MRGRCWTSGTLRTLAYGTAEKRAWEGKYGDPEIFCLGSDLCFPEIYRTWYDGLRQDPILASTLAEKLPTESSPHQWKSRPAWSGKRSPTEKSRGRAFPRKAPVRSIATTPGSPDEGVGRLVGEV